MTLGVELINNRVYNGHDADVTRCLLMTQNGHSVSFRTMGQ